MDAIEQLMNDHRVIERVCDALVGFADEARRKQATDKDELRRFVTFIREFADGCHHGKEEDILFRRMTENGFPSNGGPIAVMLMEHDEGRGLVRALSQKADQEEPWSAADLQAIADAAAQYSGLLHQHIHKEDAVLYPMAEQHLPRGDGAGERRVRVLRGAQDRRRSREVPRAGRGAGPAPRPGGPPGRPLAGIRSQAGALFAKRSVPGRTLPATQHAGRSLPATPHAGRSSGHAPPPPAEHPFTHREEAQAP